MGKMYVFGESGLEKVIGGNDIMPEKNGIGANIMDGNLLNAQQMEEAAPKTVFTEQSLGNTMDMN